MGGQQSRDILHYYCKWYILGAQEASEFALVCKDWYKTILDYENYSTFGRQLRAYQLWPARVPKIIRQPVLGLVTPYIVLYKDFISLSIVCKEMNDLPIVKTLLELWNHGEDITYQRMQAMLPSAVHRKHIYYAADKIPLISGYPGWSIKNNQIYSEYIIAIMLRPGNNAYRLFTYCLVYIDRLFAYYSRVSKQDLFALLGKFKHLYPLNYKKLVYWYNYEKTNRINESTKTNGYFMFIQWMGEFISS